MIGYKAFNSDLTCHGYQYEVGKIYTHAGDFAPCRSGFHFCKTISDCYRFYDFGSRICKVEALGEIKTDDDIKYCTNKIAIIEEIVESDLVKCNTGKDNTGYMNSGDCNSGNCNSGDCNSGYYNLGSHNTGVFNTTDNPTILMFDKPTEWTLEDFRHSEAYDRYSIILSIWHFLDKHI